MTMRPAEHKERGAVVGGIDIHKIARRLAAEKEGRANPPPARWLLAMAVMVALAAIAIAVIDSVR